LPSCLKVGITPYFVRLPVGMDPDQFMIHLKSKDQLTAYVRSSRENLLEHYINKLITSYEAEVIKKKTELLKKLDPILSMTDGTEMEVWKSHIYKRINIL
jgi:DNA primase